MESKGAQKSNHPRFQDSVGYYEVSYNMCRGPRVTLTSVSQLRGTPSLFPFLQFCNNLIYKDRRARRIWSLEDLAREDTPPSQLNISGPEAVLVTAHPSTLPVRETSHQEWEVLSK